MLRRLGLVLVALLISCASQVRTPDAPPAPARNAGSAGQEHSQMILYVRSDAPSNAPVVWEIRKIALDRADGTQVDIRGSSTSLRISEIEGAQKILHIAETYNQPSYSSHTANLTANTIGGPFK